MMRKGLEVRGMEGQHDSEVLMYRIFRHERTPKCLEEVS